MFDRGGPNIHFCDSDQSLQCRSILNRVFGQEFGEKVCFNVVTQSLERANHILKPYY